MTNPKAEPDPLSKMAEPDLVQAHKMDRAEVQACMSIEVAEDISTMEVINPKAEPDPLLQTVEPDLVQASQPTEVSKDISTMEVITHKAEPAPLLQKATTVDIASLSNFSKFLPNCSAAAKLFWNFSELFGWSTHIGPRDIPI